jgi:hypothetical protein
MKPEVWNALVKRFLIALACSTLLILGISEGFYRLNKTDSSRGPQIIELVIPEGTAEEVAAGRWVPTIPKSMVFVLGDTLMVRNDDVVDHELGPLWIPARSSASYRLDTAREVAYSCSFQPTNYMGLTVREATTWRSRLAALFYGVPPLLMFMMVYSFLVFPLKVNGQEEHEPGFAGQISDSKESDFHPEWGWNQFEDDREGSS